MNLVETYQQREFGVTEGAQATFHAKVISHHHQVPHLFFKKFLAKAHGDSLGWDHQPPYMCTWAPLSGLKWLDSTAHSGGSQIVPEQSFILKRAECLHQKFRFFCFRLGEPWIPPRQFHDSSRGVRRQANLPIQHGHILKIELVLLPHFYGTRPLHNSYQSNLRFSSFVTLIHHTTAQCWQVDQSRYPSSPFGSWN